MLGPNQAFVFLVGHGTWVDWNYELVRCLDTAAHYPCDFFLRPHFAWLMLKGRRRKHHHDWSLKHHMKRTQHQQNAHNEDSWFFFADINAFQIIMWYGLASSCPTWSRPHLSSGSRAKRMDPDHAMCSPGTWYIGTLVYYSWYILVYLHILTVTYYIGKRYTVAVCSCQEKS